MALLMVIIGVHLPDVTWTEDGDFPIRIYIQLFITPKNW